MPNLDQEGGQPTKGLAHRLDLILEVLVVVRIALQIPVHSMSQSYHTVASRYELHRCRCTAYLLISFYSVSFLKTMGMSRRSSRFFTSTRRLCCVKSALHFCGYKTPSIRARFPDLYDFIQDPGHHQQPCVYIRLSPWHSPYYVEATDQVSGS